VATISIVWNWGTNSNINFNPATDILDFGWFAADQFTISEVNGTVVITIPSNHQTYTLQHTTLSELHLSNIVAKDSSAIGAWQNALSSAPVAAPPLSAPAPAAPPPPAAPPTSGATTWSASSIYTAGMTVTENGVTYKANWWTQGVDPAHNNGGIGTGQPWTIVATASAPPTVPTTPTTAPAAPPAPSAPSTGGSPSREFAPYIDMAMPQDANLSAISAASGIHNFTLAFVLSSSSGIGWQGAGTIGDDTLANGTTILSQVQAIQAAGGDVTISFGGAAGQEAALTAMTAANLQAEYQSVIDRYHVHSLDFDIEGAAVVDQRSLTLRDQALVGLKAANPGLNISFTLPVLPTGLTADGLNVLANAKHDGSTSTSSTS
jgi:Carbohydrate binding domain